MSDVQKLKRLEEENSKLKCVVADLILDNVVWRAYWEKLLTPTGKRAAVRIAIEQHGIKQAPRLQVNTVGPLDTQKKTIQESRSGRSPEADGTGARAVTLRILATHGVAARTVNYMV